MSKIAALAAAVLIQACAIQPASAEFVSGNDLYEKMKSTDKADIVSAISFVAGVHDAGEFSAAICSPANTVLGQVFDVAKKFLADNPGVRNSSAAAIVLAALYQQWPCAKKPANARPVQQL